MSELEKEFSLALRESKAALGRVEVTGLVSLSPRNVPESKFPVASQASALTTMCCAASSERSAVGPEAMGSGGTWRRQHAR